MAKTIRQRAAAALAAAALAFSGIPKTVLHVSAIDPTHSPDALFWSDAENDQLSAISKDDWTVNQLYAKLNFAEIENDTVQGENVNVPDNTYYLLVHALISGEDKYQLIPVTNEEMGFGSEGFTDGHSAWVGDFESQDFNAKADLVEGILLKNSDPSSPLTEAQAISRSGCTAVQEIEGRKLNWDGGMNKRRVDSRYTNTFESYSVTGGHLAEIRVFDSDGWTPSYIQNGKEMNYYTLVTLFDKGTTDVKGWALRKIEPDKANMSENSWTAPDRYAEKLGFSTFYAYGTDGTQTTETIAYDPALYDVNVRIRRAAKDDVVTNYAECFDKPDVIPEYCFMQSTFTRDGFTSVNIKKDVLTYTVNLEFSEPVTITEADRIAIALKVAHQSGIDTYYFQDIIAENALNISIPIQTVDEEHWMQGNGDELEHERFTGNETDVAIKLVQIKEGKQLDDDAFKAANNVNVYEDGATVLGFDLTYLGQTDDRMAPDHVSGITNFINTLSFQKVTVAKEYDYKSILGPAIDFGITAERFRQSQHDIQSNFQADYYEMHDSAPAVNSDLGNTAGQMIAAQFVEFPNVVTPSTMEETEILDIITIDELGPLKNEKRGRIAIGTISGEKADVFVDSDERLTDSSIDKAIVHMDTPENLKARVDAAIDHMKKVSAEMAAKPANVKPIANGDKVIIDTTGYEDGVTLYVDGDALADLCIDPDGNPNIGEKLTFKVRENQTVVINFTDDKHPYLIFSQYNIDILKADGSVVNGTSAPDTGAGSAQNAFLNQAMRQIVWNMTETKLVEMGSTAGIFLLPRDLPAADGKFDDSIAYTMANACSGWLVTAGYFGNSGGEWHFPYQDMTTTNVGKNIVSINKKGITGDEVLEGATLKLTLVDAVVTEQNPTPSLENVIVTGEKSGTLQRESKSMTWVSGNADFTAEGLPDGTYTLEETGGEFEFNGKTYSVLDTTTTFTIKGGTVTSSYVTTDSTKAELPVLPGTETTGGYYRTGNTITVRDAETDENQPKIKISKMDVTGKETLEGAQLTLTLVKADNDGDDLSSVTFSGQKTGTAVSRDADSISWTSGDKDFSVSGLPDGTYTLAETGSSFTVGGKTYTVVDSTAKFVVKEGKITSASLVDENGKSGPMDSQPAADAAEGSIYCDGDKLTVCDAEAPKPENITVKVTKQVITDGKSEAPETPATYILGNVDTDKVTVDGTNVIVDKEGKTITFTGDAEITGLDKETEYTLQEIVAPDGYTVVETTLTFEIDKDGNTVLKSGATTGTIDKDENGNIIFTDKASEIKINKKDVTGENTLDGAALTLTLVNPDQAGATLEKVVVTGQKTGTEVKNDGGSITWTSGKGDFTATGLPDGTYTLAETGSSFTVDGKTYTVLDTTTTFVVENGKITSSYVTTDSSKSELKTAPAANATEGGYYRTGDTLTVCDAETKEITVKVTKQVITDGKSEAPETPATYILGNVDTDKVTVDGTDVIVDKKGKTITFTGDAEITGLDKETEYTLQEIVAPDGYTVVETTLTFEIDKDGNTVLKDGATTGTIDKDADGNIIFTDKASEVKINKKDVTGENTLDGALLTLTLVKPDQTGATLSKVTVTGQKTGTEVKNDGGSITWTSGKGDFTATGLPDGTYTLAETGSSFTVDGKTYTVLDTTTTFTIENGKITSSYVTTDSSKSELKTAPAANATEGGYYRSGDTLTVCDAETKEITVKVTKQVITDGKSEAPETPATYILGNVDTDKVTVDGTDVIVDKDGKTITFTGDAEITGLDKETEYTLQEIVAPDGYTVVETTLTFEIDKDGNTVLKSGATTGTIDKDENGNIIFTDKASEVKINKKDVTGENTLDGATLTLTLVKPDQAGATLSKVTVTGQKTGTEVKNDGGSITWTSGTGDFTATGLPDGTYTLSETGSSFTVDGKTYTVLDTTTTFTIENGKITSSYVTTDSSKSELKTAPAANATEGGYYRTGDTLTVCDAETKEITVKVTKQVITDGKSEAPETPATYILGNVDTDKVTVDGTNVIVDKEGKTITFTGDAEITGLDKETEYTLQEIVAPDGFTVVETTLTFEIDKDGNTVLKSGATTGTIDKDENGNIIFTDKASEVKINKKDVTGENTLDGATLTLTLVKPDQTGATLSKVTVTGQKTGTEVKNDGGSITWTSGTGDFTATGLPDGTYTLSETGSSFTVDGKTYTVLDTTTTFVVENGKITSSYVTTDSSKSELKAAPAANATEGGYYRTGDTLTVCDAETKEITVKVTKQVITDGKSEAPETPATYILGNVDTDKVTVDGTNVIVDKEGKTITFTGDAEITGLDKETEYTLQEIVAPDGYTVVETTLTFEIDKDGNTVLKSGATTGTIDKDADGNIIFTDKASEVKINKKDVTGENTLDGAALTLTLVKPDQAGATLEKVVVTGQKTGTEVKNDGGSITWTSGKGDFTATGLPDGTYTLAETGSSFTVDGKTYTVLDTTTTFTIENGKITSSYVTMDSSKSELKTAPAANATEGGYYRTGDTLTVCDAETKEITVKVTKQVITDGKSEAPETPATYILGNVDTDKVTVDGTNVIVDKEGKTITFTGDAEITGLDKETEYTLQEIVAPDGYTVVETTLTFEIDKDGNTVLKDGATTGTIDKDADGNIIFTDKASEVKINKKDVTGENTLDGAALTLTLVKPDQAGATLSKVTVTGQKTGKEVKNDGGSITWTSGTGDFTATGLPDGTYTLAETGSSFTVDGKTYTVLDTTTTFTIENGKITSSYVTTDSSKSELKAAPAANATEGGYYRTGDTLTVCDAETKEITVKVTKQVITDGKSEAPETPATYILGNVDTDKVTVDGTNVIVDKEGKTITFTGDAEITGLDKETEYTLQEIVAPDGYTVVETTLTFEIDKDGNTVLKSGATTGTIDKDENGNIIFTDKASEVKINKKDVTGENTLDGAALTLTLVKPDQAGATLEKVVVTGQKTGTEVKNDGGSITWTSGKGDFTATGLPDGTYTLAETGSSFTVDGKTYTVLDTTTTFTIENGKITSSYVTTDSSKSELKTAPAANATEGGYYRTGDTLTVCDAETKEITVKVTKQVITDGKSEAPETPATYILGNVDTDKVTVTGTNVIVDKEGKTITFTGDAEITGLDKETEYTLQEIVAPDGYTVVETTLTFEIDKDGNTVLKDGATTGTIDKDENGNIIFTDKASEIKINKKDVTGENILDGATLTLTLVKPDQTGATLSKVTVTGQKTGTEVKNDGGSITWTSGKGDFTATGLPDGTYTLAETGSSFTVDGKTYTVLDTTTTFTIENGKITSSFITTDSSKSELKAAPAANATEGGYYRTGDTLTVCDAETKEITVKVTKQVITDGKSEAPETPATYILGNVDTDKVTVTGTNVIVDKEGKTITFTGDAEITGLDKETEYTLQEIVAPDGYTVVETTLTFEIDKDGNTVLKSGATTGTIDKDADGNIIFTDKASEVKINKKDVTGENTLDGATLTLTLVKPDQAGATLEKVVVTGQKTGTEVKNDGGSITWTSGTGDFTATGLPDGTYTLAETGSSFTVDGKTYTVLDTTTTFTIENGKITSSFITTDSSKSELKAAPAANATEGGYYRTGDTLTVCDAETAVVTTTAATTTATTTTTTTATTTTQPATTSESTTAGTTTDTTADTTVTTTPTAVETTLPTTVTETTTQTTATVTTTETTETTTAVPTTTTETTTATTVPAATTAVTTTTTETTGSSTTTETTSSAAETTVSALTTESVATTTETTASAVTTSTVTTTTDTTAPAVTTSTVTTTTDTTAPAVTTSTVTTTTDTTAPAVTTSTVTTTTNTTAPAVTTTSTVTTTTNTTAPAVTTTSTVTTTTNTTAPAVTTSTVTTTAVTTVSSVTTSTVTTTTETTAPAVTTSTVTTTTETTAPAVTTSTVTTTTETTAPAVTTSTVTTTSETTVSVTTAQTTATTADTTVTAVTTAATTETAGFTTATDTTAATTETTAPVTSAGMISTTSDSMTSTTETTAVTTWETGDHANTEERQTTAVTDVSTSDDGVNGSRTRTSTAETETTASAPEETATTATSTVTTAATAGSTKRTTQKITSRITTTAKSGTTSGGVKTGEDVPVGLMVSCLVFGIAAIAAARRKHDDEA